MNVLRIKNCVKLYINNRIMSTLNRLAMTFKVKLGILSKEIVRQNAIF